MNELPKLQLEDPDLQPVLHAKQADIQPGPQDHQAQSSTTRRLFQLWDQLRLLNGILYCRLPLKGRSQFHDKLVVPQTMRQEILEDLHSGSFGGYLGEEKMLSKLTERFYWPGQYNDVRDWCRTCATCASRLTSLGHSCNPFE